MPFVIKTKTMVVGSRSNLKKIADNEVETPSFVIGGAEIGIVKNVKYFGVQLDDGLAWDRSTKLLCSKLSRALGVLRYAKNVY